MSSTCRGGDASVPVEIRDALISYIRKHPEVVKGHEDLARQYLDDEWFCLLGVTGGEPCSETEKLLCRYGGGEGRKIPWPKSGRRLPLGPPLPRNGRGRNEPR
jgi:hypothetical protein